MSEPKRCFLEMFGPTRFKSEEIKMKLFGLGRLQISICNFPISNYSESTCVYQSLRNVLFLTASNCSRSPRNNKDIHTYKGITFSKIQTTLKVIGHSHEFFKALFIQQIFFQTSESQEKIRNKFQKARIKIHQFRMFFFLVKISIIFFFLIMITMYFHEKVSLSLVKQFQSYEMTKDDKFLHFKDFQTL